MKPQYAPARNYFMRKMQNASTHEWPEGKLAVAVITSDYVEWEREARNTKRKVQPSKFLTGEWPTLDLWCNVAGLDRDFVIDTYMKCYRLITTGKVKE